MRVSATIVALLGLGHGLWQPSRCFLGRRLQ
jgi:hypothetical protein